MNRDQEVFAGALVLGGAERAAFLDRTCAGDTALRGRVEALLRAHDLASGFLNTPLTQNLAGSREERPSDVIGRYKLLEKIGEGGCGVVWMAEQEQPVRRRVALKVIKLGMDTKAVIARFEAERQALALMDHSNIAKIFDAGTTDAGRPYFVMELVRGIPITRFCDDASLPTGERLRLFIQVCHAIQHAHQKGIIHRDIKPSNILVTLHDDLAVPKVIDFGIAKATQGRLTDSTVFTAFEQFIGTPAYMSPEQAEFNALDVDTRSDVYSLGVLLYELITGRPPFDPKTLVAGGLDQIRRIIREVDPPRPSTRLSTATDEERTTLAKARGIVPAQLSTLIKGDLDWIVMKALEKNRVRRYESASAFAADVQRHLGHEPIAARPPSQAYLLQKLIRRHRLAFGAATAIALVLLLGATVSTWQAIRATRAERGATHAKHAAEEARKVAVRGEQEQSRLRTVEAALRSRAEVQTLAARRAAYASDMNLLPQALAIDNLGRAQELLNRQRPKTGEADLRGWEWRYLWQFCQSDAHLRLTDQPKDPSLRAVSPDGKWLITSNPPARSFLLWDLSTRQRSAIPILPAPEGIQMGAIAFSPRESLLAISWAVGEDVTTQTGRVRLWNFATQQTVREWDLSRPGGIGFSDDGQTLLSRGYKFGGLSFWRVSTGEHLKTYSELTRDAAALSLTGDFSRAAVELGDRSVQMVDIATGQQIWKARLWREDPKKVIVSPDGKMVAVASSSAEGAIYLLDATNGQLAGKLEGLHSYPNAMCFWPDSKTLATGGMDQTIRLWDLSSCKLLRVFRGHTRPVHVLKLLGDGKTLLSAAGDATLRFWDTTVTRPPAFSRIEHDLVHPAKVWRFSADSQSIIALARTGNLMRYHGRDFQQSNLLLAGKFPADHCLANDVPLVSITRQNPRASRSSEAKDGFVTQIWNWETAAMVHEFAPHADWLGAVAFREQGTKLLTGQHPRVRELAEWDVSTGKKLRSWPRTALNGNYVVSPDGLQCLFRPDNLLGGYPSDAVDDRARASDGSVIDFASGVERALPGLQAGGKKNANFSADGRFFATPSGDSATILETATFSAVRTLSVGGMFSGNQGANFSPDGRRLVVASSATEAVRLWDTEGGQPVLTLPAPAAMFTWPKFSPDGNVLAVMNIFGQLHLWRAPSWAEIAAAEKAMK